MSKPGRNDPCPCGSRQKFKRCCLLKQTPAPSAAAPRHAVSGGMLATNLPEQYSLPQGDYDPAEELTRLSNEAVDLVHEGNLEKAELIARDLLARFPEIHDGYDRLGMIHEARGEAKLAADCYRNAVAVIRSHPQLYDPQFEDLFHELIEKLDPSPAS